MSSDRVPIFIWQIYFPVPVPGKFPAKRFDDASACKHARFPARSLARLKRRNSRGEILEGNSSAYLPGRHRAPPGASSTPLPSTGTSSSWRSLCRMTRARALLTASQNVSHSPKDLPKVNLSRHIFLVPREKSHRTHAGIPWRDTVSALARWPRGRSPLARTLLLTRWYCDQVSEILRESRHDRDEEDRWRVSDWRNNDCARRAASRDAQMFGFLVGMELAVVAIPSSFDSLCIRNAGIHVSGFALFAG